MSATGTELATGPAPAAAASATAAPAFCGAFTGARMVAEVRKLLRGEHAASLAGAEVLESLQSPGQLLTRATRNPGCRFDHRTSVIEPLGEPSLGEALALAGEAPDAELFVEGDAFATRLRCDHCPHEEPVAFARSAPLRAAGPRCRHCGGRLLVDGFRQRDALRRDELPERLRARPLAAFGLRQRDVFGVRGPGGERFFELAARGQPEPPRGSVVLVGAGNIGSHAADLLAREADVKRILVIDFDAYEAGNRGGQNIRRADVGRAKAEVVAGRLGAFRDDLEVVPICDRLENVPLGLLRGSLLLGALDSRGARMALSRVGWRLGCPIVDGAVDAEGLLSRVCVWRPGPQAPCVECGFSARDYALLGERAPCEEDGRR